MNNENNTEKKSGFAASFNSKYFRLGGYSTIVALVIIAVAVVINLIVGMLPSTVTKLDTSSMSLYTLSDKTRDLVKAIDDDITIYFIAQSGAEDSTISELIDRYAALNSRISIKTVDPVINPNFTAAYAESGVTENSLIIEGSRRFRIVTYEDIFVTNYSFDANYNVSTSTTFAGESAITSALDYITSDTVSKVYFLSGHGESDFSETMLGYLNDDNIDSATVSLLAAGMVPEDCTCLIVNVPTSDVSADEAAMILDYMKNGGKAIFITGYLDGAAMPNLYGIGEYYGIIAHSGLVVEGSTDHYYRYPYYLLPKFGSHEIISSIENSNFYTFMVQAMGLTAAETMPRTSVSVSQLMYTTASAYLKTGEFETVEQADGDVKGVYSVAMAAEENDTKLVWYASPYIVDASADQIVSGGNSTFFLSSLTWICGKSASVSIATKSMQVAALVLTDSEASLWSIIVVGVIPLLFAGTGFYVWMKRRKR